MQGPDTRPCAGALNERTSIPGAMKGSFNEGQSRTIETGSILSEGCDERAMLNGRASIPGEP